MLDKTMRALLSSALRTTDGAELAQEVLSKTVLPWRNDGSSPPHLCRYTGDGQRVAVADRRCGGYQNTHRPDVIGWEARLPTTVGWRTASGTVTVPNPEDPGVVQAAIELAQEKADEALLLLAERSHHGGWCVL